MSEFSSLNERQVSATRWLSKKLPDTSRHLVWSFVQDHCGLNPAELDLLVSFLSDKGCILIEKQLAGETQIRVTPEMVKLVERMDAPPPRNYRYEILSWVDSKPWGLAVVIVFGGIPAIAGYIQGFQFLLKYLWLGE